MSSHSLPHIVIRHATLIDGTGSAPLPDARVVVDGERIARVGPDAGPVEAGTEIDASGYFLLPGFFDVHVHFGAEGPDLLTQLLRPASYTVLLAEDRMRRTLAAGVTTARDLAGVDRGLKMAQQEGLVVGPRLQIAVSLLSITGGHGDPSTPGSGMALGGSPWFEVVNGPADVLAAVRRVIHAGADVVKVASTGGVLSPHDDPRHSHFSPEELSVIAAEARRQGRRLAAHAQGAEGIKNAVRAGFTSIEHGIYLDQEAIDLMLAHGTVLVPTLLAPMAVLEAADAGAPVPPWALAKAAAVIDAHRESVARAHRAGVKIVLGTDSGVGRHGTNLRELSQLVAVGLTPMEAIRAGTLSAAELMGLEQELGTVEPGKRADLVLTPVNPLTHIDGLADPDNIRMVMQDGRLVKGPSLG